jgi:methionyl-tRNA synthetase
MDNKFYITTTLPYVNAKPHIGFALEIIQADVLARWHRSQGAEVFFNTGTDEHGAKIYQKAIELGKTPQVYCDELVQTFKTLEEKLDLSIDNFIRTTDAHHVVAAQEFWKRCDANGDIYKKIYKTKYCIGCELEKTDSELVNGRCPLHPNKGVEIIEEENYFFKFSKYQKQLQDFYNANPNFVVPEGRFNEIKSFVAGGLQDFSVSRVKEKMPWGIAVPGDENQVMYVWFDALVNYISCLGWPNDEKKFEEFWGTKENRNAIQVAGKDNLRQQSAMWQAMLMSAGLPNSKQIFIHGFITANGQKMSKSLGNVIDPVELVEKYGTDAVRYFLLRELPPTEDGDFSFEKFEERYNSDLAKGIGNLAARVVTVAKKSGIDLTAKLDLEHIGGELKAEIEAAKNAVSASLLGYRFNEALAAIWKLITYCDQYTSQKEPWKTNDRIVLFNLLFALSEISNLITPFLPVTSLKMNKLLTGEATGVLFPRIDNAKQG